MELRWDKKRKVAHFYHNWTKVAYIKFRLSGLAFNIEFPSDWHEERRAWVRFGYGIGSVAFSFPWAWVVPDNYQCSGPEYGFVFFDDSLHLHWGKCNGKRNDPIKIIAMPWQWRFVEHKVLSEKETHDYTYTLKSGEAQERKATIKKQSRRWWRPWFPYKLYRESIDIEELYQEIYSGEI